MALTYGEIYDSIAGNQTIRFIDRQWRTIMDPMPNIRIYHRWHNFTVWAMFISSDRCYCNCITIMLDVNKPEEVDDDL